MRYFSALALLSLATSATAQAGPPIPRNLISDPLSIVSILPTSTFSSLTSGVLPPPITPSSVSTTAPTSSTTAPPSSNAPSGTSNTPSATRSSSGASNSSPSGSGSATSSAPSATKSGAATGVAAKGLGVTFAAGLLAVALL
ncbi:hypothetical protein B0H11DRAFT_2182841 [Mycena galericulata]|nr:hypothetical protein B0H11DRAFT_2182841 [Mycena galericulata]